MLAVLLVVFGVLAASALLFVCALIAHQRWRNG